MYNSLCWLALTLSLCYRVLTEEVFESYTTLSGPTNIVWHLDITPSGDTLFSASNDGKTYIYSISGTTITSQQIIPRTGVDSNNGPSISADGQTLLASAGKVFKKNVVNGDYELFQNLTTNEESSFGCMTQDAEFIAFGTGP